MGTDYVADPEDDLKRLGMKLGGKVRFVKARCKTSFTWSNLCKLGNIVIQ